MKIKAILKPSPTRHFKLTLLAIILGGIIYLKFSDPPLCCLPILNPVDEVTGQLRGMENLRWAQLKIGPVTFLTDDALENEIVTGTTGGGWYTDVDPDFEWEAGYPTPTGGFIIFEPQSIWPTNRIKLIRTPATLNSPADWSGHFAPPNKWE